MKRAWAAAAALFVLVLAVYAPATDHGFVNYDDHDVVRDNARFEQPPGEAIADILTERTLFSWQPLYFL